MADSNFRRLLPIAPVLSGHEFNIGDPQRIVAGELDVLAKWAAANLSASKQDFLRYWFMKIPAVLCGLGVAGSKQLGFGDFAVAVLGLCSTFLITIDALWPGGLAFNAHRRAANEIRRLQLDSHTAWNQALLTFSTNPDKLREAAVEILKNIRTERTRIDQQVTAAETSLDRKNEK